MKPHLTKGFKVSNDPLFEEKVADIVGLYLDPPERALALCIDKSRKSRRWTGLSRGYRSRTATPKLFAALDVKSGKVIDESLPRHRARSP